MTGLRGVWPTKLAADGVLSHLDSVEITGIRVQCVVGVYPYERRESQPVEVDFCIYLDTRKAAATGSLEYTVDYARLAGEIRFLLETCRFKLLESAATALCRYLLAPPSEDRLRPRGVAAAVRLTKPTALHGMGQPTLTVLRYSEELSIKTEEKLFGSLDILYESRDCGIYRRRLAPGRSIPTHFHQEMDESELVLGDCLKAQGTLVDSGSVLHWPRGLPHRYDNDGGTEQSLLCVNRPRFIPSDEQRIDVEVGTLPRIPIYNYYPDATRSWSSIRSNTANLGGMSCRRK